jgi:hypothetical protein
VTCEKANDGEETNEPVIDVNAFDRIQGKKKARKQSQLLATR